MTRMAWRSLLPGCLAVLGAVALLGAACGGGGSGNNGAGTGKGITDPARVASSTPIGQDAILYQIRGDTIQTTGGISATVAPGTNPTSSAGQTYTVKSGDTCAGIASQYGVSLDAFMKANRTIDANCTNLTVGDAVKIPGASATPTSSASGGGGATATPKPGGAKTYVVKSGDTCDGIATSQGVDLQKLISLNKLDSDCRNLQVGQILQLP